MHWSRSSIFSGSPNVQSTPLFETKYGFRLELYDGDSLKITNIHAFSSHTEQCKDPSRKCGDETKASTKLPVLEDLPSKKRTAVERTPISKAHYRYRLFPDWQTSYLWHDNYEPLYSLGNTHIDADVIEDRYPTLAPLYFEWQEIYETAFERQKCHLGSGKEVFPGVHERVAWEAEGLLIACWLALQDDVEKVEYKPSKAYRLERGWMEGELLRFLGDMEVLLESRPDSSQNGI